MKKQNANNKLAFNKVAVIELTNQQMYHVDGGSSLACVAAVASSAACVGMSTADVGIIIAWALD